MDAIIWDFDGTLFDTYKEIVKAFKRMLDEEKIMDNSTEKILKLMRNSVTEAINYYIDNHSLTQDAIDRFNKYEKDIDIKNVELYPNVREILQYIYNNNKMNFLYTHRDNSANEYLKYQNLDKYFKECITRENGFSAKPSPEAIIYLMDKYNLNRNKTIIVGDRKIDILSGQNAGIKGVFFKWNKYEQDLITADYNIANFDELKKII